MSTATHPPGRRRRRPRGRGIGLAWALVIVAGGVAPDRTRAADPPATRPTPFFNASRYFRTQSPEPFDIATPPVGEPLAAAPPVASTEPALADLPPLPGPALKSSLGPIGATAGCATCGGMGQLAAPDGVGFRSCSTCSGTGCTPGRRNSPPLEGHSFLGRFCGELYQSLCCPDPCYEPGWVPAANAAFFQDYARPRTLQRIRNDYGWGLQFPDRNEFFWARQQIQGVAGGRGPGKPSRFPKNQVYRGVGSVDYDQFSFYSETATGARASLFVEIPYRISQPADGSNYHAGFSDINFGTKGVIFDTELLLLTIQFRTFTPVGNASFGLGTGHISLEPSLLASLKLGPDTYLQGQLAEWIPIGGDNNYQGSVLHYHTSLNQVLFRLAANSPIIGTLEANAWSFQDGLYTDPYTKAGTPAYRHSSGDTYFNIGPGLRASICDAIDFGGAIAFPVSEPHWDNPLLRLEFRILY